jgi:hypothetical protein
VACSFQFLQLVAHLPLGEQGVPEADPDLGVYVRVVVMAEQQAAGRQGVGDPAGEHQEAGAFGEQPVTARVSRRHQPGCSPHQLRRHLRRSRRSLPRGSGQPGDGLGVVLSGAARQLLGHLQGRRSRSRQPLPGLTVQPAADGHRQILVDGITDQVVAEVVAESETGTVIFQHPSGDRIGQYLE